MTETSPTAQRREVGTLLRAHRERAGMTAAEVAARVGVSAAKLSRLERGLRGLQISDVRSLCTLYRLSQEETRDLLAATRASREPGWWSSYSDLDAAAPLFYGLEAAAREINSFHALCVPGLLQTASYAEALLDRVRPPGGFTSEAVQERVEARMRRKQALDSKLDRVFHFIIDEAALLRPIGSAGTMHAQFEEILGFSAAPNVTVQVVPFAAGPHPGVDGSFTIQKFDQENLHDVVFVEGLAGAWLIDNVDHVRLYREVFSVLSERALDPEASRHWLRRLRSA